MSDEKELETLTPETSLSEQVDTVSDEMEVELNNGKGDDE
nr:MAG TPA: hypothetical protein [Caudoviricetes sp.]